MGHDAITKAFSGIEAPIVAMNCLHAALQDALNRSIPKPRALAAIEIDPDAQHEILLMMDQAGEGCLFADLASFFDPALQGMMKNLKSANALDDLMPAIKSGRSVKVVGW